MCVCVLVTQSCPTLCDPMNCSHSLLQGIIPIVQTQGLNLGFLHYRQILYRLSLQENPCNLCKRAESLQKCPTLCDPRDCSPPGSSVRGFLQAGILWWVAMPSPRGSSQPRDGTPVSYVSCIDRLVLYPQCHLGSPQIHYQPIKSFVHLIYFELLYTF